MADFRTLSDLLEMSADQHRERDLFGEKRDGRWSFIKYGEFKSLVDAFRASLADLGVGPGDRVAIVSNNRVEWAASAYATYGRGAAFVPMYESQVPEEWEFILNDCGAKVVVSGTASIHDRLIAMRPRLSASPHVVGLELPPGDPFSFATLVERGKGQESPPVSPSPDDVAAILYTSGTTGMPKGVILTHANICSNVNAVHQIFPFEGDELSLSFLPWAHAFGQTCELHVLLSMGSTIAINDDVAHLLGNLAEVRPTLLFAVPRIFNRIYEGVNRQMADKPQFIRSLFRAGVRNATRRNRGDALTPLSSLSVSLADRLIFEKVRARFGGRLKYVISGSAALSQEVAEFIDALGIPVYEGYGLTETSPIVTATFPSHRKIGSVGRPIPGVTVEIDTTAAGDTLPGEIVVRGPNVTRGYLNRPEENATLFTPDGALRTGDLGSIDADGYLYVTGRIKEQYKLENGKYVAPAPLEEAIRLSPFVANAMVYGDNRPFNVALVVVELDAVRAWAKERGLTLGPDLTRDPEVISLVQRELDDRTAPYKSYERPKRFALLREDFSTDNGLLTPTLKLRRRRVFEFYEGTIQGLYPLESAGRPQPRARPPGGS